MKSKYSDNEAKKYISNYAKRGVSKDLALRIYTTQLLGNDPTVVLHGGGNTSVKSSIKTLLGNQEEIIYVKGSGKDMGNIEEDGFPALEMKNLLNMQSLKVLDDFQMVNYQRKYMLDTSFPNASVETLLHAFLPHKFVDHSHSNAILSLIDQPDPIKICKKVFGEEMGIVPYIMPGFQLAQKAAERYTSLNNIAYNSKIALLASVLVFSTSYAFKKVKSNNKARDDVELILKGLLFVSSLMAILTTLGIILSLLFESLKFFSTINLFDFIFGTSWSPQRAFVRDASTITPEEYLELKDAFGSVPLFAGTAFIAFIAMCVAVPIGLFSGIYLAEYASTKVRKYSKPIIEILAGIPHQTAK